MCMIPEHASEAAGEHVCLWECRVHGRIVVKSNHIRVLQEVIALDRLNILAKRHLIFALEVHFFIAFSIQKVVQTLLHDPHVPLVVHNHSIHEIRDSCEQRSLRSRVTHLHVDNKTLARLL